MQKKCHPMSINFVSLRDDGSQGHSSSLAVQEAQKETHTLESNKGQIEAQGTGARKILESTRDESSTLNGKSYLETPLPVKLLKHGKIPDTTSSAFSEHTGSKENLVMSTVQSLDHALNASRPSLSSKNLVNQEKKGISSDDELWVQDANDDSIANERLYICVLTRVSPSPSPPRTRSLSPPGRCQDKYHLKRATLCH